MTEDLLLEVGSVSVTHELGLALDFTDVHIYAELSKRVIWMRTVKPEEAASFIRKGNPGAGLALVIISDAKTMI